MGKPNFRDEFKRDAVAQIVNRRVKLGLTHIRCKFDNSGG